MQRLDYIQVCRDQESIAEGVILPSGQFALCWHGLCHSHGVFPSFARFQEMQAMRAGRLIRRMDASPTADNCSRTFYLQRNEDWSGISGTGLVAVGFEFDRITMLHWLDSQGSTFWYESVAMVEHVHGHEGRTVIARCTMAPSLGCV